MTEEIHTYHHYDDNGPRITVKAERNSRGTNWEATVTNAKTIDIALELLTDAMQKLSIHFTPVQPSVGED